MPIAIIAQEEVDEMFERIDKDGDRCINFEEFSALLLEMDHARSHAELRPSFDAIDQDRDGRVSREEFRVWVAR